ncbi:pyrroline-5-carboxylate reductase dimerization domain-containing protein [Desulfovibrio sp. 1188_IL3213]|uniref:pyrroline-5-carboxylate reductase dimerization domain-containing protein n=1 Tax=unclassified Desulfovibrio TaxID=2593640 RepID=UPI003FA58FF3
MDSLCEAGVSVGLTRKTSQTIAATLMDGCANMAIQTGRHPVILREQGPSPWA